MLDHKKLISDTADTSGTDVQAPAEEQINETANTIRQIESTGEGEPEGLQLPDGSSDAAKDTGSPRPGSVPDIADRSSPRARALAILGQSPADGRQPRSLSLSNQNSRGAAPVPAIAPPGGEGGNKFKETYGGETRYILCDQYYNSHIVNGHAFGAVYKSKNRFRKGFNIRDAIDTTLKSDTVHVRENTAGRAGYIFEMDFGYEIGLSGTGGNPLHIMRVVVGSDRTVITAMPVGRMGGGESV